MGSKGEKKKRKKAGRKEDAAEPGKLKTKVYGPGRDQSIQSVDHTAD